MRKVSIALAIRRRTNDGEFAAKWKSLSLSWRTRVKLQLCRIVTRRQEQRRKVKERRALTIHDDGSLVKFACCAARRGRG